MMTCPVRPLQPTIPGDRCMLSENARAKARQLAGPHPAYFLSQLVLAWMVIIGAVAWAAHTNNLWASLLTIFIVATRQNVLALLVHEQAHCLGFKPRFGDLLTNLFAAYPLLFLTVEGYAKVHLSHHRYFFSEQDPDHIRKNGPDWTTPMTVGKLTKLLAADILGLNVLKLVKGKRMPRGAATEFSRKSYPAFRLAFLLGAATIFTVTGTWHAFLLYWALPLLTVFQAIVRWGALAEHKYNLPGASVAEATPVIIPSWFDRIVLPNLNFSMHVYHHYFPGVSSSNLPKLHDIYLQDGLVDETALFHGNRAYLKFLLGMGKPQTSQVESART